ncbi:hypothetical protein GCM10008967_35870 [Bacillus carboniphilus]|uniref:Glycosyltransferase n=1 Tax=Bacillus carboniphilus TaxID=86663 RepID=A0ABP3GCS7_9BACI
MYKKLIAVALIFSITFLNTAFVSVSEAKQDTRQICLNEKVISLKYGMQKLWIEHAWWTRSLIVSDLADAEDQEEVLERLLQNQVEIGNIIKPYYGEKAGNKLTDLLKEHIVIAGELVDAAKVKDQKKVDLLNKELFRNADDIVAFLTSANPNWDKKLLTEMFYKHLELTIDEVVLRLKKDWKGDIRTADMNEEHLIEMGDMLTDGIVKQFPEQFK